MSSLAILKKKSELSTQLKNTTNELKDLQDKLINTCNVQKDIMEYCLVNIDDENDYKEAIENLQIQLRLVLNRHYTLMYNDALRSFRETNELKISCHRLVETLFEFKRNRNILHHENQDLERQIDELDKTRGEFQKESQDLSKKIMGLKDKLAALDAEEEKLNVKPKSGTCTCKS